MEYLFTSPETSGAETYSSCSDWYYQNCSDYISTNVTGPCDTCESTCAKTCYAACDFTCVAVGYGVCSTCYGNLLLPGTT